MKKVIREIYYDYERIIGKKIENGSLFLKVKWTGYPLSKSTWEQVKNFTDLKELSKKIQQFDEQCRDISSLKNVKVISSKKQKKAKKSLQKRKSSSSQRKSKKNIKKKRRRVSCSNNEDVDSDIENDTKKIFVKQK